MMKANQSADIFNSHRCPLGAINDGPYNKDDIGTLKAERLLQRYRKTNVCNKFFSLENCQIPKADEGEH